MRPVQHRGADGSFGLNTFNLMHMLDLATNAIKSASVRSHAHTYTHVHAPPLKPKFYRNFWIALMTLLGELSNSSVCAAEGLLP